MSRDYQEALRQQAAADFAKAVSLLKNIVEDGKERPVQLRARQLLNEIENQATGKLAEARTLLDKGQTRQGFEMLTGLTTQYSGTPAAREAAVLSQSLTVRTENNTERAQRRATCSPGPRRTTRPSCTCAAWTAARYSSATIPTCRRRPKRARLAQEIKTNPEWTKMAADQVADRLCLLYLSLADTWLKKGQPQQATFYLERVIHLFPNSRHAEIAQVRLSQIQGAPSKSVEFKK